MEPPKSNQSWFNTVALVISLVVVVGFLAGLGLGGSQAIGSSSGSGAGNGASPTTIYLTISTLPDGADQYMPANFSVPIGVPVTFVVSSYDNGVNNLTAAASTVTGTTTGTESISGGAPGTPQGVVRSLPEGDTAHTFSIVSSGMNLNAVIPPSSDPSIAVEVTFTVIFSHSGSYTWLCLAPCDNTSMSDLGFMTGTVTVE